MNTLPVTMTVDDELARLRSMLADLRTLNKDMARICNERDRHRAALCVVADMIKARINYDTLESFIGDFDFRPGGSLTAPAKPLTT